MVKKDLKKTEHISERHEVAEDIVAIRNLKSFSQEKKDELIQGLLEKKVLTQTPVEKACPFPQHKGYAELWKKLSLEGQKQMKENFRISADGKIESIKMKKKFSVLTAKHNGKNIFDGNYEDKNKNKGIKGVTYLTSKAAEQECKKQGLVPGLLKNKTEVEQFISFFPGESTKEKIFNFVQLFGLEKAGYWNPTDEGWHGVGSVGDACLSRVDGNGDVYGVRWLDDGANIGRYGQKFSSLFVACEDCSA